MSKSVMEEIDTAETSDFQDRSIMCVDCGEPFVWTVGEQVFFHDKGMLANLHELHEEAAKN